MANPKRRKAARPRKATIKQERFAREYVANGGNGAQAYRDSYDTNGAPVSTVAAEGTRLKQSPLIAPLIEKARQAIADEFTLSRADVLRQMAENRDAALAFKQAAPAVRATELLGKELHAMFGERVEITARIETLTATLKDVTTDELRALLKGDAADTPALDVGAEDEATPS